MPDIDTIKQLGEYGIGTLLAMVLILISWGQWQSIRSNAKIREQEAVNDRAEIDERGKMLNMLENMLARVLTQQTDQFATLQSTYIEQFGKLQTGYLDRFEKLSVGLETAFNSRFDEAEGAMQGAATERLQTLQLLGDSINGIAPEVKKNLDEHLESITPKFNNIESVLRALSEDLFQRWSALENKLSTSQNGLLREVSEVKELIAALKVAVSIKENVLNAPETS